MVYTAGALTKVGELTAAGFSPRDLMPLIPVEQHLGRGLQVVMNPSLLVFGVLTVTNVLSTPAFSRPRTDEEVTRAENSRKFALGFAVFMLVTLVPFISLSGLGAFAIGAGAAFVVYSTAFWSPPLLRRTARNHALVLLLPFYLGWTVGMTFLQASPLPRATLEAETGTIRGPLLVQTDGNWYIGGKDNSFRVVPADQVKRSQVDSLERRADRSLVDLVFP